MKILLTGANGYIGSHLLQELIQDGHEIIALVRESSHFSPPKNALVNVYIADLLNRETLKNLPKDIDAAYYLVHSMKKKSVDFQEDEELSAKNFCEILANTNCKQIIYLGALAAHSSSEHMSSRRNVEKILSSGKIPVTAFRASIIIGRGGASFEILHDLVEKLPIMITPKWVESLCQPIALEDVMFYLKAALLNDACLNKVLEIGGPEILSYRKMLLGYAKVRGLKRWVIPVPFLTPRLSSYWLVFISSTSFPLAKALVSSLKIDSICTDDSVKKLIPHECIRYEQALQKTLHPS